MASPELIEQARVDYGIVNSDQMSDEQLKAEMKAIDDQPKSADDYVAPKKAPAKPAEKKEVKKESKIKKAVNKVTGKK